MKFNAWLGLPPDGFSMLHRRLAGLQMDYGQAFKSNLTSNDHEVSLTITECLYRDIFQAENVAQLTATTCCSQDRIWIETGQYKGIVSGLVSSQAEGDLQCCFSVVRLPPTLAK